MAAALVTLELPFFDFDIVELEMKLAGPPRCPHSIMLFRAEIQTGKSNYCLSCTPSGPQGTRNLVIPETLAARPMRANLNSAGECPGCHSHIHEVVSEKIWKCGECGEEFPAPRKRYHG